MLRYLLYLSVLCWYCLFCLQKSNKSKLWKQTNKIKSNKHTHKKQNKKTQPNNPPKKQKNTHTYKNKQTKKTTPKVCTRGKIYSNLSFSHGIFTVLSLPVSGSAIEVNEEYKRGVLNFFKPLNSFEVWARTSANSYIIWIWSPLFIMVIRFLSFFLFVND